MPGESIGIGQQFGFHENGVGIGGYSGGVLVEISEPCDEMHTSLHTFGIAVGQSIAVDGEV